LDFRRSGAVLLRHARPVPGLGHRPGCGEIGETDYERGWQDCRTPAAFDQWLCDAWTSEYLAGCGAAGADLVVVDPGNGFSYVFDLAGSLRREAPRGHPPRGVGVWGLSRVGGSGGITAGCAGILAPVGTPTIAAT
jgi:hypothetical protein